MHSPQASNLLAGRWLLFVGNSVVRRLAFTALSAVACPDSVVWQPKPGSNSIYDFRGARRHTAWRVDLDPRLVEPRSCAPTPVIPPLCELGDDPPGSGEPRGSHVALSFRTALPPLSRCLFSCPTLTTPTATTLSYAFTDTPPEINTARLLQLWARERAAGAVCASAAPIVILQASSFSRRAALEYATLVANLTSGALPRPRFLLLSPAHTQDLAADGTPVAPKAARRHRNDAEAERILTKSLASRGIAVVPVSSRTAAAFASGAIRHEPRGNGSATRLYHFDDAGRLLILQLVVESLAGLAGDR